MTVSPFSLILCAGAIAFGGVVAGVLLGVAAVMELGLAAGRLGEDGR